jgi:hypothetical protein
MQGDQSFDFATFVRMKDIYDLLSAGPHARTAPGQDAPAYPFAPTGEDKTGGPTQGQVGINAFAAPGSVLEAEWPTPIAAQPQISPWRPEY